MWPNPVLQASLRREQEISLASKDFAKDNAKRIKQMAVERMRRTANAMIEEERQKRKPLKATKQFEHVKPKVNTNYSARSSRTRNGREMTLKSQNQPPQSKKYDENCEEEEFQVENEDDWRLSLSGRETRFSEIDVDTRREKIRQIVQEICSVRPTAEGPYRLSRTGRTSSLRRSPSLQSLRSLSLQSVIRTPLPPRRSPSMSSTVSRSCQTEGETALGPMPLVATSKEVLMPIDKQKKSKRKSNTKKKPPLPPPSPSVSLFDRLSAIESEVRDLKLDLNGIEGALDAENVDNDGAAIVADEDLSHKEETNDVALNAVESNSKVVDYVSANIDAASEVGHARRTINSARSNGRSSEINMHEAGTVPKYLKQRQKKWLREEEQRRKDDEETAFCPPGHKKLSKLEQERILSELKQEWEETVRNQTLLPVGSDTLRVRNRRRELESQLDKLDEAIRTYSRPVVYIKEQDKEEGD